MEESVHCLKSTMGELKQDSEKVAKHLGIEFDENSDTCSIKTANKLIRQLKQISSLNNV